MRHATRTRAAEKKTAPEGGRQRLAVLFIAIGTDDPDHFFELLRAAALAPCASSSSRLDGCTGAKAGRIA